ncbi:TetR/AcrR family transcriptional regulator [Nocardioides marmotae]|uniref:TetR/AcrR family transcriptional regulator n=1 Tax=Nocardioides marmotae TaxID=2663857 RepID=UPI001C12E23B|nr:TetR/AcrR family transcriptional regulator [Nocardioides marmotae]
MSSAPRQGLGSRRAETVERLFAAGAEELDEVGHEALTIRSVAGRAGVSPATAYTYFASKNHLFAELFWRHLAEDADREPEGGDPVARVQDVTRRMAERLADSPALAAAVTPALLSSDADVARLRLRIGGEFLDRFSRALGEQADPAVLEALVLAFSGALLQAGMGVMTYTDMGERLDAVVAAILEGHA